MAVILGCLLSAGINLFAPVHIYSAVWVYSRSLSLLSFSHYGVTLVLIAAYIIADNTYIWIHLSSVMHGPCPIFFHQRQKTGGECVFLLAGGEGGKEGVLLLLPGFYFYLPHENNPFDDGWSGGKKQEYFIPFPFPILGSAFCFLLLFSS